MSLLTPNELSLFYGNRNASVCHTRLATFELRYPTGLYEKVDLMDTLFYLSHLIDGNLTRFITLQAAD